MKITTKFLGSSALVLVSIIALVAGSSIWLKRAQQSVENSSQRTERAIAIILTLEVSLRDQVVALKDFLLLNRMASDMAKYQKAKSNFLLGLDELERLVPEMPELAVTRRRHDKLDRLAARLTDTSSSLPQLQQDVRAINSFRNDIEFYLDYVAEVAEQEREIAKLKSIEFGNTKLAIEVAIIGLVFLVFLAQFILIMLPASRSIRKLQMGAATIGGGNLDYRLKIHTGDEIEELARKFNKMAEKLSASYGVLEEKVRERTSELTETNQNLEKEIRDRALAQTKLQEALEELTQAQSQLIQAEKMSSLGQLVAGIAHEINNPVSFIYGNIAPARQYIEDLIYLLKTYQTIYPNPDPDILEKIELIDLDFVIEDLPKLLNSMQSGSDRIREIVLNLRNFSRLDEAKYKEVNIHEGIDSTLMILQPRLKAQPNRPAIEVIRQYGQLPLVECYPGQLNQVLMNLLANAIDALEDKELTIKNPELEIGNWESEIQNSKLEIVNRKSGSGHWAVEIRHQSLGDLEEEYTAKKTKIRTKDLKLKTQNSKLYPIPNSQFPILNSQFPTIRIRTEAIADDWVAIRIADNGSGMPEEVRSKLFDPFFTTKPVGKGTGLGLSISYQIIVEQHGGRLNCWSEPGQGTEFAIEIPLRHPEKTRD